MAPIKPSTNCSSNEECREKFPFPHLRLDDQGVGDREAVEHLGELHKLLPAPIVLLLAEPVQRVRVLGLFRVLVDDGDGELRKVRPAGQQLVVVGDAEEERQVVADVAAVRVDEDVPGVLVALRWESLIMSYRDSSSAVSHKWLLRCCCFFLCPRCRKTAADWSDSGTSGGGSRHAAQRNGAAAAAALPLLALPAHAALKLLLLIVSAPADGRGLQRQQQRWLQGCELRGRETAPLPLLHGAASARRRSSSTLASLLAPLCAAPRSRSQLCATPPPNHMHTSSPLVVPDLKLRAAELALVDLAEAVDFPREFAE